MYDFVSFFLSHVCMFVKSLNCQHVLSHQVGLDQGLSNFHEPWPRSKFN